jgi:hypothetical protein
VKERRVLPIESGGAIQRLSDEGLVRAASELGMNVGVTRVGAEVSVLGWSAMADVSGIR